MTENYCGMIAIVGRPNVGKSTILNRILGQKVSITSRKPQTTRHRIMGIDTLDNKQAIYVDTPGLHGDEKKAINKLMNKAAASSLSDVSMVLFVIEGTRWTDDDDLVLTKIKQSGLPCWLVINKIDMVPEPGKLLDTLKELNKKHDFAHLLPVSAKQGKQIDNLRQLIFDQLPAGEFYYPEDYVTDRSSRFMAAEIIREKLMRFTGDELPYAVTVEIEQFTLTPSGVYHIHGLILVDRASQKPMIIGKQGSHLKTMGAEARKDMEALFDNKVFLELWVKVKSGWADDERALRSLGYEEDYRS
ncbi:MAG: GTP-binding protein Era [Kangiellaceae bacterium]|jgi:GTP-binding protein Era